jgi:hypothetical protein
MVAAEMAIVREDARQRYREEEWLEWPCWWQRGKDGRQGKPVTPRFRACPEPEPACWHRLCLEPSSFSSISVTRVIASPLTGTRHLPIKYSHTIIHRFPVLLRLSRQAVIHTTTIMTVFSGSYHNKYLHLVDTLIHPLQKMRMKPFNVCRFHTSTHRETQLPRNANFRQCEDLPLSSRSVLMSSFTWGCSHRRSASSRSIGGKGLRGKPP